MKPVLTETAAPSGFDPAGCPGEVVTRAVRNRGRHVTDQSGKLERAAARLEKRGLLAAGGPLRGFVGTVSEATHLIGQHQDAGIDLLINADRRNDMETSELFVSDIMPHFA